MGLPEVLIAFKSKAVSAIKRSQKGVVALLIKDTATASVVAYKGIEDVPGGTYEAKNVDYINKTFMGTPSKVIVVNIGTEGTVAEGLNLIKNMKINYLAAPFATAEDATAIASFIKSQRLNKRKTIKAVLPSNKADDEGVINFTAEEIKVGEKEYTTAEYTARVAGALAGLPFTRSATYYVFPEVDSVKEVEDPDAAIDAGELILIHDGEKTKIGRAVNSLTTFTVQKSKQFSKIKRVEGMDFVKDDIRDTFNDSYVGKVINNYDNKLLFLGAVNAYFKIIANDNILDINYDNRAEINFEAQYLYLKSIGVNVDELTIQQILEYNTDEKVFAGAAVKFVDAMEDLFLDIAV
ncbi:phage tail sheath C-terminal domain-containing protein [Sporosarcina sp. P17b]|uniref:phage tail sheath C-terminal domain-containing protein n=1 Tax=Sporosarcina sp. P17b TaxID=2048260 RepID=UPI000C16A835|nr:phage tail sheath C-terminal domain-containing protein [Sporosarcina sp. P17b]PIC72430.1 phage tail sheath protein [Sporosarcina sp. P17b]